MGWETWSFALSLLALVCSGLAAVFTARRTPTAAALAAQKLAEDTARQWREECKLFEATRTRWSEEFQGIADRCDETFERTESKRRRIAASESRGRNGAPPVQVENADPWAGMTREEIVSTGRRLLRGQG